MYRPTRHAGGAWNADELHFSPVGGLVTHAIERFLAAREGAGGDAGSEMHVSRISFDILGRIAVDDMEIHVETIRPGRTIELVEATLVIAGRSVVRARAWLLSAGDTASVAGGGTEPLPHPDRAEPWPMADIWPGGFIASIDVRTIGLPQPGRTTAWLTTGLDLVAGEPAGPLASYVALVDTANGIATRQPPGKWMFPNVDLTLHLHRQPQGSWVGLDTAVTFGDSGHGVTSTVLHDIHGPIGQCQQMLTVRPLEAP
ncbi:thioesterase family protein [Streptomyces sp. NPDC056061]|uniref:thioesterase family protein n=1 Tax=Streptomyces sp. NPDC056061 TaxID=3345700 RepID=UPI0035DB5B82